MGNFDWRTPRDKLLRESETTDTIRFYEYLKRNDTNKPPK